MKENTKYWAKNDEFKIADIKHDIAPNDPFKT
jgi:hypothetical protein